MTFYPTYFTDQDKQNWDRLLRNNDATDWFEVPKNAELNLYSSYPTTPNAEVFGNDALESTVLYLLPPSTEGHLRYVSIKGLDDVPTVHIVPIDSAEAMLFFMVFDSLFGLQCGDFLDYGFFVLYQGSQGGCYKYSSKLGKPFTW